MPAGLMWRGNVDIHRLFREFTKIKAHRSRPNVSLSAALPRWALFLSRDPEEKELTFPLYRSNFSEVMTSSGKFLRGESHGGGHGQCPDLHKHTFSDCEGGANFGAANISSFPLCPLHSDVIDWSD